MRPATLCLHVGVDDHVVVLAPVLDLGGRGRHAVRHDGLRVLVARLEPPLQRLAVGRQDEDAHHVAREALLELPCALPVDVEQHVACRPSGPRAPAPCGVRVELAEHLRPFEQLAPALQPLELCLVDEGVVGAVHLAAPRPCAS